MSTDRSRIEVRGIPIEIRRKDIRNLHVGVYPPDGKVRVAVPLHIGDQAVRQAIVSRLRWIQRQIRSFSDQERQSLREMVTGESHYYFGKRYRLSVVERSGPPQLRLAGTTKLELRVRPGADRATRQQCLDQWYRRQLRAMIRELLERWPPLAGVTVSECRIKRMKTRWGSCNAEAGRIWLNLELAKKPPQCVEYIFVHEMVHLLERGHNDRFRHFMDRFLPDWRLRRDELNKAPLAHDDWDY